MRTDDCRVVRDSLLDQALAGVGEGSPPGAVKEHLRHCPGCAKYLEGLRAASGLSRPEPLYTPALRRRTLAAVAKAGAIRPLWLAPLLLPASALSVAVSVVAPVWLLTFLLRPLLGSEWLSLGFAFALTSSTGLAVAGLGLALLTWRRTASSAPAPAGALFPEVHLEVHHE